jgi:hypothetical protein
MENHNQQHGGEIVEKKVKIDFFSQKRRKRHPQKNSIFVPPAESLLSFLPFAFRNE